MKDKEYEKWKTLRAKGAIRYIILYGVLLWGGTMFVVMTLLKNDHNTTLPTWQTLSTFSIWALAGIIFGAVHWLIMEFLFKKAQKRRMAEGGPV
jgi:hypothetical protein